MVAPAVVGVRVHLALPRCLCVRPRTTLALFMTPAMPPQTFGTSQRAQGKMPQRACRFEARTYVATRWCSMPKGFSSPAERKRRYPRRAVCVASSRAISTRMGCLSGGDAGWRTWTGCEGEGCKASQRMGSQGWASSRRKHRVEAARNLQRKGGAPFRARVARIRNPGVERRWHDSFCQATSFMRSRPECY